MTVQDIITRVRQIVQETDTTNTHASDSAILGWINACTLQLCSTIATLPKEKITNLVAASTVTVDKTLLRIDYIAISDDATTPVYTPLETIDFSNFVRLNPDWENQSTNKPQQFVRMTDKSWMMFPAPDSTWTGNTLHIVGSVVPDDLTSTTEEPPVSLVLHPAYPHYCAWLFFLVLNNPTRAAGEFAVYDAMRKMNTQTATSTTGSHQAFKIRGM